MDTERLSSIPQPLLCWFEANARELPWREQQTYPAPNGQERQACLAPNGQERPGAPMMIAGERSYRVWVSEIMLQQTRVEAVKPYYLRFMAALPDVAALASCPEDRLLKLWEGLGYYNRVRNMQKAARIAMEQYEGRLPETYEELLALPGIGSYTAGAIASIAYGQVVPAVDGNVLRVVSRITGSREDISRQSVRKGFEELLQRMMEQELMAGCAGTAGEEKQKLPCISGNLPGTFNQALMELGAIVCLPGGAPDCQRCPVAHICYANETGCQLELPVKTSQKARRIERKTVLVIRDSGRCAVRKRPGKGLLAGLYELPNAEGHLSQEEALARVQGWGFSPIRITPLPEAKHIFSHIEWQMAGYMVLVEDMEQETGLPGSGAEDGIPCTEPSGPEDGTLSIKPSGPEDGILFIEPSRTEREYPIPAAFAAYTKYLSIRLGQEKYTRTEGETR